MTTPVSAALAPPRANIRRVQRAPLAPRWADVATALALLVAAAMPLVQSRNPSVATLVILAVTGLAVYAILSSARRSSARLRGTWRAIGVALLLSLAASTMWTLSATDVSTPGISLADIIYFCSLSLLLVALGGFTEYAWESGAKLRVGLDLGVFVGASILLSHLLAWRQVAAAADGPFRIALLLGYPAIAIVLYSVTTILLMRTTGTLQRDLVLTSVAFLLLAIASTTLALASIGEVGRTMSAVAIFGFAAAPALLGIAALASRSNGEHPPRVQMSASGSVLAALPDLAAFGAALACIARGLDHAAEWVLAAVVIALTVVRQAVVRADNHRLRKDLELRVHDRTEALRALAHQHRNVLDSIGNGILGTDNDGVVEVANPAAAKILGAPPSVLAGTPLCSWIPDHSDDSCPLHLALRGEEGTTGRALVIPLVRVSGEPITIEATIARMARADGRFGIVLAFNDITDRTMVDRMKREFVSAVSHELRTPLTAIRGSLEMLVDGEAGDLPPMAQELAQVASRGSERLGRLVNDIIDVERLETGRLKVELAPYQVKRLIDNAVRLMEPVAKTRGINLVSGNVGGIALCDPDRVNQVVVNLLDNALKFTGAGRSVMIQASTTRAGHVLFEVRDEGRGIPEDQLDMVFRPFHQVMGSDSNTLGGTGLGLAITRAIIEQHGGDIWVESQVGKGSLFCFTLPAPDEDELAAWSPPEVSTVAEPALEAPAKPVASGPTPPRAPAAPARAAAAPSRSAAARVSAPVRP